MPSYFKSECVFSPEMLIYKSVRDLCVKHPSKSRWYSHIGRCSHHLVYELQTMGSIPEHSATYQLRHAAHRLTCAEIDNGVHAEIIEPMAQNGRQVHDVVRGAVQRSGYALQYPAIGASGGLSAPKSSIMASTDRASDCSPFVCQSCTSSSMTIG